jgi:hypothetical protein
LNELLVSDELNRRVVILQVVFEGRHDDIPAEAFYFAGGIEEIRNRPPHG